MPDFPAPLPRPNPFRCCAERHLWRHGLALAIYKKVGELTNGGQRNYFTDTAKMALFFGANKAYVRRAFAALDRAGFLVVATIEDAGTMKAVKRARGVKVRRWIHHKDWAEAHAGQCIEVDEALMPWSEGADPLCGQLYAALDGKMRLYEGLLKFARSCGRPDKEVVAALSANWEAAKARKARGDYNRTGVKGVFFDTIKALKDEAATVVGATCR